MVSTAGFSLGSITRSGTVVLVPGGDLTAQAAPVLSTRLAELIDMLGRRDITVDLHLAEEVDPAVVDVLAHASGWLRDLGGTLTVENVPEAARPLLDGRVPMSDARPGLAAQCP